MDHVNDLLRAQAGAVHHRQARAAGMSERQIAGRLDARAWAERHPRVYVVAGAPEAFETECSAALLAVRHAARTGVPRGVAVAGLAAAYLHDLGVPRPGRVDLVVPGGDSAPRLDGVRVVRASTWPSRVFTRTGGLLVTSVADTIVDIGWYVPRDRLHAIVQEAAFARPGLAGAVLQACRRGRTGSAAARRAAALVLAGVDSSLHAQGHALVRRSGLPAPECGVVVAPRAGPSDCVLRRRDGGGPPYGLVVEWDGDAHRVDRRTFLHDREKDRLLRRAGYLTLRYTAEQVRRADDVIADLNAAWEALSGRSLQPVRRSHAS